MKNKLLILTLLLGADIAAGIPCKVSPIGVDLVKSFEGYQQKAYWDHNAWAVGYGSRGKGIGPKTWWSSAQAEVVLGLELDEFARLICSARKVQTQGELDALVSLAYNVGFYRLKKAGFLTEKSTKQLLRRWKLYTKSGGVHLAGLKRRRLAEIKVFQEGK